MGNSGYSIYSLPIETNAIEVDFQGLESCVNNYNNLKNASIYKEDFIRGCVLQNTRVKINKNKYEELNYYGPGPSFDYYLNAQGNTNFNVPPPTRCMIALDQAQHEPFKLTSPITNQENNLNQENTYNSYIFVIALIIIIFLLRK